MDFGQIEQTLHRTFKNVERHSDDDGVFRCERRNSGSPMSIYYVGVSESLEPEFDLDAYLERFIAHDFYRNGGPIQWNYYLIFVVDQDAHKRLLSNGFASKIENHRAYARKFVVEESHLADFLHRSFVSKSPSTSGLSDFESRWRQVLDQSGMGDITDRNMTELVRDWQSGKFDKRTGAAIPAAASVPMKLQRIAALHIENYRSRIRSGTYPICRVNLLTGANGTGKTSFLEALELCICGATAKNGAEKSAQLSLEYSSGVIDKPNMPDTFYRARDGGLYGRSYSRGNQLPQAFAKHNFFSTDAAYKLAHEDTPEEISKALSSFIVGSELTSLEEKLSKLDDLVKKALDKLKKEQTAIESELQEIKTRIEQMQRKIVLGETEEKRRNDVLKEVPLRTEAGTPDLAAVRECYMHASAIIDQISEEIDWIHPLSIDSITNELKKLQFIKERTDQLVVSISTLEQKKEACDSEKTNHAEKIKILDRLCMYLKLDWHEHIDGMEEQLIALRSSAALRQSLSTLKNRCETSISKHLLEMTIAEATETLHKEGESSRKQLEAVRLEISALSSQAKRDSELLSQVKGAARAYMDFSKIDDHCPVCSAKYSPIKLHQFLMDTSPPNTQGSLGQLIERRVALENMSSQLSKSHGDMNEAIVMAEILSIDSVANIAVAEILREFDHVATNLAGVDAQITRFESYKAHMTSLSLSETDFQKTRAKAERLLAGDLQNHKLILSEIESTKVSMASAELLSKQVEVQISTARSEQENLLREAFKGLKETSYLSKLLPERVGILDRSSSSLDDLLEDIAVPSNVDLNQLAANLKIQISKIDDWAMLKARAQEASISLGKDQTRRDEIIERLPLNQKERSNLEFAQDVIGKIVHDDNIEKNLREFIDAYHRSIVEVFSEIHVPREFIGLKLGQGGTSEFLLLKDNGEVVNLNQISTGQRGALALSVFMAMHHSVRSKVDLVLIDDPVAHIDDLNSLSFLDYLRNLALGGTQIFFATADSKLAKLFEMKFEFLSGSGEFQRLDFNIDGQITSSNPLVRAKQPN